MFYRPPQLFVIFGPFVVGVILGGRAFSSSGETKAQLPVTVYVQGGVAKTPLSGLLANKQRVADAVKTANALFAPLGITFVIAETKPLPGDGIRSVAERNALAAYVDRDGTIPLFFVSRLANKDRKGGWIGGVHWRGRVKGRQVRRYVIVSLQHARQSTLAHELGHWFGLGHTKNADNMMASPGRKTVARFDARQLARMKRRLRLMLRRGGVVPAIPWSKASVIDLRLLNGGKASGASKLPTRPSTAMLERRISSRTTRLAKAGRTGPAGRAPRLFAIRPAGRAAQSERLAGGLSIRTRCQVGRTGRRASCIDGLYDERTRRWILGSHRNKDDRRILGRGGWLERVIRVTSADRERVSILVGQSWFSNGAAHANNELRCLTLSRRRARGALRLSQVVVGARWLLRSFKTRSTPNRSPFAPLQPPKTSFLVGSNNVTLCLPAPYQWAGSLLVVPLSQARL